MVSLALALHALLAYFSVATCNNGCGEKPQNQYSIRLLAPIDNGKWRWKIIHFTSHNLLPMNDALVSWGNEACKRYANLFGAHS
ncbi:MAG TPA: hypothetical protein VE715_00410 [Blastocatellia bacterium]|nr:hypothetical protein [Blastocatellia bacterium]